MRDLSEDDEPEYCLEIYLEHRNSTEHADFIWSTQVLVAQRAEEAELQQLAGKALDAFIAQDKK